ncbi:hypothetical protein SARC_04122 [Sphaeroforma arctica JP610]|uniref:Uncharacterized protein n=1 Tax=Sphaeroforma arctica JP610 TaxID=667725 RepID=A0A0L0G5Y4_9EUKA|nr:hypothetical protein SARC_04122 [Sphaeroforma arctica JP610]KNC83623.1 hypothetical protein SARC_04122 [Sphaeroforma arctica JP610]|eukprot:XP_014157525.1 hypothetical protein SARC_04122 [Sphaeroforma arctica JP610]
MVEWLANELQVTTPTDLSGECARAGSESEDAQVDVERKVIIDYFLRELTKLGRVKRGVDRLGALLTQWKQSGGYPKDSPSSDISAHALSWTTAENPAKVTVAEKIVYRTVPCTMPMTSDEHAEFAQLKAAVVRLRECSPGVPHRAIREYIASYLVESTSVFDDTLTRDVNFPGVSSGGNGDWHSHAPMEGVNSKYPYLSHSNLVRKAVGRNAPGITASMHRANNKLRTEQNEARIEALRVTDARISSVNEIFYAFVGWVLAWFYQFQNDDGMHSLKLDGTYLAVYVVVGYLLKAVLNRFVVANLPISDALTGAQEPRLTVRELGKELKVTHPDATSFDSRVYITLFANAEL